MHSVVAFIALLFATTCLGAHHFAERYPFSITLSENEYYLYWNFSLTDETIQFAVSVKTTGWVGFGISPNGQMPGSDVVIGWVDGDDTYFHDRYAEGRFLPPIDNMQDWFLISAAVHDGYTELEFSRNFTTCDNESRDLDIKIETSRVVYSWNDNTPTVSGSRGAETYSIEGHQQKGSASVNLLGGLPSAPSIPDNAETFTVKVDDAALPSTETTYWCRGIALDSLVNNPDQEKYIIQFGPSITEGSEDYVHHVLVYTCDGLTSDDLGSGGNCHQQSSRVNECRGSTGLLIAAWAVGGIPFTYPENVAYPIGGTDAHKFFVIEMHYNNPMQHSGVIDNSGLEFTYLNDGREHKAGIMFLGHQVSYFMAIPPKANNYTISSYCPANCTHEFFPATGIKIFASMLHTHLAGTGVSLSVIRENNKGTYDEVKPIDKNLKYDFNFQQVTHLPEEITVMPGDELLVNCYYDTSSRTTTTFGGESTEEEMCLTFPVYYPRIELTNCESVPVFDKLTDFVLTDVPPSQQIAFASLTNDFSLANVRNAMDQVEWDDTIIQALQDKTYARGNQYAYCWSSADTTFDHTAPVPNVTSYYSPPAPVRNCTATEDAGDGASLIHLSIVSVIFMATATSYILWN